MAAACIALGTAGAFAARPVTARAEEFPPAVTATYRIAYIGVEIGTFQFTATNNGSAYTLNGSAQLSLLLGALKWSGTTAASGAIAGAGLKPASYAYDFKSNKKTGSVRLALSNNAVTSLSVVPPSEPSPEHVPLRPEHLKQVLDPMSAVMALSRGDAVAGNPCSRRLQIFDGKQRFDLQMSPHGQQRITETRPSGQPVVAHVCRVRYQPIAGHRQNAENRKMAENTNIEVALRPIPSANLFVPYKISIPTVAGTVTMIAQRVQITTANRAQIALTH